MSDGGRCYAHGEAGAGAFGTCRARWEGVPCLGTGGTLSVVHGSLLFPGGEFATSIDLHVSLVNGGVACSEVEEGREVDKGEIVGGELGVASVVGVCGWVSRINR